MDLSFRKDRCPSADPDHRGGFFVQREDAVYPGRPVHGFPLKEIISFINRNQVLFPKIIGETAIGCSGSGFFIDAAGRSEIPAKGRAGLPEHIEAKVRTGRKSMKTDHPVSTGDLAKPIPIHDHRI